MSFVSDHPDADPEAYLNMVEKIFKEYPITDYKEAVIF